MLCQMRPHMAMNMKINKRPLFPGTIFVPWHNFCSIKNIFYFWFHAKNKNNNNNNKASFRTFEHSSRSKIRNHITALSNEVSDLALVFHDLRNMKSYYLFSKVIIILRTFGKNIDLKMQFLTLSLIRFLPQEISSSSSGKSLNIFLFMIRKLFLTVSHLGDLQFHEKKQQLDGNFHCFISVSG